jgi:hypothetical protein
VRICGQILHLKGIGQIVKEQFTAVGAVGRTHGMAGRSVDKVDTLRGQLLHIGRLRLGIAGKATRLIAQLIGKEVDQIRRLGHYAELSSDDVDKSKYVEILVSLSYHFEMPQESNLHSSWPPRISATSALI